MNEVQGCGTFSHFNRRTLLKAAGLSGIGWLTPLAERLAHCADNDKTGAPAKTVIVLWLAGGPSQLETFDPHPGSKIAAGSRARNTSVPGIQLAESFEQVADQMEHISLVRSILSKEGDHERATYNMKTGFRPDPTVVHPSLGSIICHLTTDNVEIPRHVSILPGQFSARGGELGPKYDAFRVFDPRRPIPDIRPRVKKERFEERLKNQSPVELEFGRGRIIAKRKAAIVTPYDPAAKKALELDKTGHLLTMNRARRMMDSDQLKAFDINEEPESVRAQFGDTPFGRSCLAAVRLASVGVRCIEVTLRGWDTHSGNHEAVANQVKILDPAFAALIRELKARDLFDSTVVMCGGEFGRTPGRPGSPGLNGADGRDHWPHGFSVALAGGGIRGGKVVGETTTTPFYGDNEREKNVADPQSISNINATVMHLLGIDYQDQWFTRFERSMHYVDRDLSGEMAQPIKALLPA